MFLLLARYSFRLFPNFRWDALWGIYSDVTLPYLYLRYLPAEIMLLGFPKREPMLCLILKPEQQKLRFFLHVICFYEQANSRTSWQKALPIVIVIVHLHRVSLWILHYSPFFKLCLFWGYLVLIG